MGLLAEDDVRRVSRVARAASMSERVHFETMTMEEYRGLKEFDITFGIVPTRFGCCLIGTHAAKICYMSLFDEGRDNSAIDILQREWPKARLTEDAKHVEHLVHDIFAGGESTRPLHVLLRGTAMQCRVWMEVTRVPLGTTATYEQIAKAVGIPRAIRAVATAVAANKIAFLVPCHRVVRKSGALSKYRWGLERKQRILKWERSSS